MWHDFCPSTQKTSVEQGCEAQEYFPRLTKEKPMAVQQPEELFNTFLEATHSNAILDQKTTVMIEMAVAMTVGCSP